MAKKCLICNSPVGFFAGQVVLSDGSICDSCWSKAGGTNDFLELATAKKKYSSQDILKKINNKGFTVINSDDFSPNLLLGKFEFDDKSKIVKVKSQLIKEELISYSDIIDFELLENGSSIVKGGLGRAIVGGALLGGIGATVGAVTGTKKSQSVCESLKIKITIRNNSSPAIFVDYITFPEKTSSYIYKEAFENAHKALSALQCAVDSITQNKVVPTSDPTDEIRKYKQLLDENIITSEEFELKKKQLLGL